MQSVENNAPQLVSYVRSAVLPSKTGYGISSVAFAAPVCVFKTTKYPDAAKAWLKYFCSKDVQLKAMKELSLVNSRIDVMNDPYFQNDPWFKPITEQTKRATAGDMPIPEWSEICAWPSGPLSAMFTEIMTGGDIQTALDGCMDKVKAITRK
jgi:multiple sugar transport system substrate-binding protein